MAAGWQGIIGPSASAPHAQAIPPHSQVAAALVSSAPLALHRDR